MRIGQTSAGALNRVASGSATATSTTQVGTEIATRSRRASDTTPSTAARSSRDSATKRAVACEIPRSETRSATTPTLMASAKTP